MHANEAHFFLSFPAIKVTSQNSPATKCLNILSRILIHWIVEPPIGCISEAAVSSTSICPSSISLSLLDILLLLFVIPYGMLDFAYAKMFFSKEQKLTRVIVARYHNWMLVNTFEYMQINQNDLKAIKFVCMYLLFVSSPVPLLQ